MGRRERYIPLTDAQLQKLEEAELAKQKLVENRRQLTDMALRSQRKEQLIQILTKLYAENIHAQRLKNSLASPSRLQRYWVLKR